MSNEIQRRHLDIAFKKLRSPVMMAIDQERRNAEKNKPLWVVYGETTEKILRSYGQTFAKVLPPEFSNRANPRTEPITSLKQDELVQRVLARPEGERSTLDLMSHGDYCRHIATLKDKCIYNGLPSPFTGTPEYEAKLESDRQRGIFVVPGDAYYPRMAEELEKVMVAEQIERFFCIIFRPGNPVESINFERGFNEDYFRTFFEDRMMQVLRYLAVGGEFYAQVPIQLLGEADETVKGSVSKKKRNQEILTRKLERRGFATLFDEDASVVRIDRLR